MTEFIKESELDYEAILERVGAYTQGDEDFDVFKCPSCGRRFLIEFEGDTIFCNPDDLSVLASRNSFSCLSCGFTIPAGDPIIGPKAGDGYRLTKQQVLASKWSWLLPKTISTL